MKGLELATYELGLTFDEREEIRLAMARTAVISKEVFEQVEAVKARESITKNQEAFKRVSDATGRSVGTISANYYREARNRKKGSSLAGTLRSSARPARDRSKEINWLAEQLVKTAQRIAVLLAEQQQELADERRRIEKAKQAIINA